MDRLVVACQSLSNRIHSLSIILLVVLGCESRFASADTFPYVAYVTSENEYVRSGPGQRYYPTSQLPQGFAVEVYRHEADGWCAIRPPEGSFSWVASHQVRRVDAKVVEVVEDNVVTRVGSKLSPARSAVQVLLPRGEHVALIPTVEDEDPRWVRVAPPSGEFRWIAADQLSRQAPIEIKPKQESNVPPVTNPAGSGWSRRSEQSEQGEVVRINESEQPLANPTASADLQFTRQLPKPIEKPVTATPSDPNAMDIVAGSPAEMQLAQFQMQPTPPALIQGGTTAPTAQVSSQPPVSVAQAPRPRVRFRGLSSSSPATVASIEELELRLSQNIMQPPAQWELEPLKSVANGMLQNTKTPALKAQLREVLARLERFEEIKAGYTNPGPTIVPVREQPADPFEATEVAAAESGKPERELTGLSADVRERIQEDLEAEGRVASRPPAPSPVNRPLYDATGLLKPVVSQRHKAPQFALVDEQGKVVSFVTPTPELDLKPYVGRRIGVHGDRGYMPEYRRAHVTAGRVTPIEGGTIRR